MLGLHSTRVSSILLNGGDPITTLWTSVVAYVLTADPLADVLAWLRSKDGRIVCGLAGLEPDRVARIAHRLDAERDASRIDVE